MILVLGEILFDLFDLNDIQIDRGHDTGTVKVTMSEKEHTFTIIPDTAWAYIAARTIQFFSPGVPQVYYVGLLAGENDIELLEKTKLGRNINRHNYTIEEIREDIKKPVVKRLLNLMEFRNSYPAFNGEFHLLKSTDTELSIEWTHKKHIATARINVKTYEIKITYTDPVASRIVEFLV